MRVRENGPMATILETTRIRLREFTEINLDPLATMVADKHQMRFYPRPRTRDEASDWIIRNVGLYEQFGFGFWCMESVMSSDFVGYCGIRPHQELPEIEMGWHTRKKYWNQGLATEAALACRDLAFTRFQLQRLIAIIDPPNIASQRVGEKIGMEFEREIVLDAYPCLLYSIDSK